MTYTAAGLTTGGRTARYQIQHDGSLSQADGDGPDRAGSVVQAAQFVVAHCATIGHHWSFRGEGVRHE